jgi:class 3 adenylate cyclase/tetratricopeptide (TPR) repeat protein
VICPACGAENRPGAKFCGVCGSTLSMTCPNGHPVTPGFRFCDECGAVVGDTSSPGATPGTGPSPSTPLVAGSPAVERRLVSVLFVDLVGFTSLSEARDAEETRELLSRYFETAQRLIGRYGGAIEKFIGDAVMAVWGTPTAQEDDAERAVRAALDLTAGVAELGAEVGAPDLRARAGVLTGEAAVTIGAQGQGMVAGDLVNTASRIQSAASPGQVMVGGVTRRATEAAIVYEDAGSHELKGKSESVPLWRAVRVIGGVRGARRSAGLEPPFVGRDREMRLLKEMFHSSAEERKAQLVSVVGIAGIGKSRLAWEFDKYTDGLAEVIWWHRGRCLAYGEGVTYWALAEMVRMRCRIIEGEETDTAMAKLRETIALHVDDPEERQWIEPRLGHLLGLEERTARDREDLFSAWRLFFERMADKGPVAMVFEDMQWADTSLLDFVEYLLEWSRNFPIFIITLSRPDLLDRRPNWGAASRNFTSAFLEPLSPEAMEALLSGLVPGLPDELSTQILNRAEGIPLYAVETVRMLIDRGLLALEGSRYRPTGPVETLEVPESLHGLIAARLDGLTQEERKIIQDASVIGKTFTKPALAWVSGIPEDRLEPILAAVVRKEVLTLQADPRSPERGQYGFLQDLVKRVAYETLSKRECKARHLAMAAYLESNWAAEEEEIVEVIASHYAEGFSLAPDAADAEEIKGKARDALVRAGERAASLAANEEAQHYFERAMDLESDPLERAHLAERAGESARAGAHADVAVGHFEQAIHAFDAEDQTHAAARVSASLGDVLWRQGHIEQGIERMESAFAVLGTETPDEDVARLAETLARLHYFNGDMSKAAERVEQALEIAEAQWLPAVLTNAFNTKSFLVGANGRPEEELALIIHATKIAEENDVTAAALRSYNNLASALSERDRRDEAFQWIEKALTLARRLGDRLSEWRLLGFTADLLGDRGDWDEALDRAAEMTNVEDPRGISLAAPALFPNLAILHVHRGEREKAERAMEHVSHYETSGDVQDRSLYFAARALLLRLDGRLEEALKAAEDALAARPAFPLRTLFVREGLIQGLEAAFALGDLGKVEELLAILEGARPSEIPPILRGEGARFRSRLAWVTGDQEHVEPGFKTAAGMFREVGVPLRLAIVLLEHGEWLVQQGRATDAEPLLREAREIFERLKAKPWLERLAKSESALATARA